MMTNEELVKNLRSVRRAILIKMFGVTTTKVTSWIEEGVSWYDPQTQTCDLIDATLWYLRIRTGEDTTLKQQKLEKDIEYKDAQIQKIRDSVIDRSEHEQILSTRAASLRQFFEQTAILNASRFVDLSMDQARTQLLNIFIKAMDSYCGDGSAEGVDVEKAVMDLS